MNFSTGFVTSGAGAIICSILRENPETRSWICILVWRQWTRKQAGQAGHRYKHDNHVSETCKYKYEFEFATRKLWFELHQIIFILVESKIFRNYLDSLATNRKVNFTELNNLKLDLPDRKICHHFGFSECRGFIWNKNNVPGHVIALEHHQLKLRKQHWRNSRLKLTVI